MSLRMLSTIGLTGKQTLRDDIESLLYVVLYCALLWLPHELSREKLRATITAIFEFSEWSPLAKALTAGDGKLDNAMTCYGTGAANFNPPLQKWLDTVMDHHVPVPANDFRKSSPQWSVDQLEALWADFLQTKTLKSDDRITHDHPRARDTHEPQLGLDSTEAIILGKRTSEERDVKPDEREEPKRRKGKQAAIESSGPRRSRRLAKKEKLKLDPPSPLPGPRPPRRKTPAQSAPRSPAKRRTRHR